MSNWRDNYWRQNPRSVEAIIKTLEKWGMKVPDKFREIDERFKK